MAKHVSKVNKLESEVENLWKEIKILSEQYSKQENLHKKFLRELSQQIEESGRHAVRSNREVSRVF